MYPEKQQRMVQGFRPLCTDVAPDEAPKLLAMAWPSTAFVAIWEVHQWMEDLSL